MTHVKKYEEDAIEVFQTVKSDDFEYVPSEEEYGTTIDEWGIPEELVRGISGCDDFALACRALLKQRGCNPQLAFFRIRGEHGTLACLVGNLALEVNQEGLARLVELTEDREYDFIAMSGSEPGDDWNFVDRVVSTNTRIKPEIVTYTS